MINEKHSTWQVKDLNYKLKSKQEYADLGFVKVPDKEYVNNYIRTSTFTEDELMNKLSPNDSTQVKKALDIISINTNKDLTTEDIIFHIKPIIKIDNIFIAAFPNYLTYNLPIIYEMLFASINKYLNDKGKTFEKLAQGAAKALPIKAITFNPGYLNKYGTDGAIKFRKSFWALEASSHPQSKEALRKCHCN
jgi:hypothetical protein